MYDCCGRTFDTYNGIRNHLDNSYAHSNEIECRWCTLRWPTHDGKARRKHEMDAHWYYCQEEDCDWRFESEDGLNEHMEDEHPPNYCYGCKRRFQNLNSLNQHLKSSVHVGKNVKCPWCANKYTNLTGVCHHLESGNCESGINRAKINQYCREVDSGHVFTNKQIGWYGDNGQSTATIATEASWDGYFYRCYFCGKGFDLLRGLNQHLASPAHQSKDYHCPRCQTEFVALSGLVNHMESESCGDFSFKPTFGGLAFVDQLRIGY